MRRYLILILLVVPFVISCDNLCSDYDCWASATTRSIACLDSNTKVVEKQDWFAPCNIADLDNLTKVNTCCAWNLNWSFYEYEDCGENELCHNGDCNECDTTSNNVCDAECASLDPDCTDLDGDGSPSILDCDDTDATVYPGANEVCDGIDNNCDEILPSNEYDLDKDGHFSCTDCNDFNPYVYPDSKNIHCGCPSDIINEICDDKIDNDCDGDIDSKDLGCSDIFDETFNVGSSVIAKAEVGEAKDNTPVYFTDKSLGENLNSWFWDFGDNSTSTEKDPSHTYETPGNYNVVLSVSNDESTDSFAFIVDVKCKGNCSTNADCDDDNDLTVDVCSLADTCNANCVFLTCKPPCIDNAGCDDNNNETQNICRDIGSCNSYCSNPPVDFDIEIVSPIEGEYNSYDIFMNVSAAEGAKCFYQLNKGNKVSLNKMQTTLKPRPKANELVVECSHEGEEVSKEVEFYVGLKKKEGFFTKVWKYIKSIFTKKKLNTDVDEEKANSVFSEAFGKSDADKVDKTMKTMENSEMEKTASKGENGTTVTVSITPDRVLHNVTIYERVPKSVAENASDIQFNDPNVEIILDDPLFVWHFEEIKTQVDLSYTVKGDIDEEEPTTVPVAEELGEPVTDEMVNEITGAAIGSQNIFRIIGPLLAVPLIGLVLVFFSRFSKKSEESTVPLEESMSREEKKLTQYVINHVVLGENMDEIKERLRKEGKDPVVIKKVFSDLQSEL